MDIEEIREHVKCCACGAEMKKSRYINSICLDKKATWKNNTWGNVLVPGSGGRAVAIVCDECIEQKTGPEFAVEWDDDFEVRYHRITELEDVPKITEEDVALGESLRNNRLRLLSKKL